MTRRRASASFAIAAIAAIAIALGVAILAACSGSSTSALPPQTGILIRAETLTSGKGCGVEPSQIYKYVVVVSGYDGVGDPAQPTSYTAAITTNIFDCYTDGAFIKLPASNGSSTFRLEVFAYNRAAYDAARGVLDRATMVGRVLSDADLPPLVAFSKELPTTSPTWTTECSATQQERVEALASCKPLAAGLGGIGGKLGPTTIVLDLTKLSLPDGRVATCTALPPTDGGVDDGGDGGEEAGAEAGAEDAGESDASDASPAVDASTGDGFASLGFEKVRVRTRIEAQILADAVVSCSAPYSLEVAATPARYDLDVGLLDSAGNLVDPAAVTVCSANSVPGAASSAICP